MSTETPSLETFLSDSAGQSTSGAKLARLESTSPPRKRAKLSEVTRTSTVHDRLADLEAYNLARQSGLPCTLPPFAQIHQLASHQSNRDLALAYRNTHRTLESCTMLRVLVGARSLVLSYDQSEKVDEKELYSLQQFDRAIRRGFCLVFLLGFITGSRRELESFRRDDHRIGRSYNTEWHAAGYPDFFYDNIRVSDDDDDEEGVISHVHLVEGHMQRLWELNGCPNLKLVWSRAATALDQYEELIMLH